MSLSRIPLPSIAHVLASDRAPLPPRPSVIKFEFDPLQTIYPTSLDRDRMLDPLGIQNDSIDVQTDQHGKVPVADEPPSSFFCLANDSSTVGHSDHRKLDDGLDAQTAEKRPTTSHGSSKSKALSGDIMLKGNFVGLATTIRTMLQFKLKESPMNKIAPVTKAVVDT